MNYYISDMHFMHKNVTGEGKNFDNRPYATMKEMHDDMIDKWNKKVTNGDRVFILGDISLHKCNEELISLVARLKGSKTLILGNHDNVSDARYRQLFTEIVPYKEITDNINGKNYNLVLSHYPIMMWNGQHRGVIHLYGHVHAQHDEEFYQNAVAQLNEWYRERDAERYNPFYAYNVGCMHFGYEPVSLEEILNNKLK